MHVYPQPGRYSQAGGIGRLTSATAVIESRKAIYEYNRVDLDTYIEPVFFVISPLYQTQNSSTQAKVAIMTTLSRDGYQWTAGAGLTKGVPTIGLIEPSSNTTGQDEIYDLIVVGAGYAALTAARDATTSGMSCFHAKAKVYPVGS